MHHQRYKRQIDNLRIVAHEQTASLRIIGSSLRDIYEIISNIKRKTVSQPITS